MERFSTLTSDEIDDLMASTIPVNTERKSKWATKTFESWLDAWKTTGLAQGQLVVNKSLQEMSPSDLNFALKHFIFSARKIDGTKYPPGSLKGIVGGIFHHVHFHLKKVWNFFNDDVFEQSRQALSAAMKISRSEGNGLHTKKAAEISLKDEDDLWSNGTFGFENPVKLIKTLLFYNGLIFTLRARQEHKNLKIDKQFKIGRDENGKYLSYEETVSKTNYGGLNAKCKPKNIKVYELEGSDKCLVQMFELYMSKRENIKTQDFYLTPNQFWENSGVWFIKTPMGVNKIGEVTANIMKTLKKEDIHFTNHSLRRTAIKRLQCTDDITSISQRSGHRSIDGLAEYTNLNNEDFLRQQNSLYGSETASSSNNNPIPPIVSKICLAP